MVSNVLHFNALQKYNKTIISGTQCINLENSIPISGQNVLAELVN